MSRYLILAALIATLGGMAGVSRANILWDFSMTGSAAGETMLIQTDGNLVAGAAPTGTYHFISITLTGSNQVPGLVGSTLIDSQPTSGFIWDGSAPTQFFRFDGALTNGANISGPSSNGVTSPRWILDVNFGRFTDQTDSNPTVSGGLNVQARSVPEPASLALLAVGGVVMLRSRRRRK